MKTIEVTVSHRGEITIETRGFTGPACRDASRALEQALGAPASERLSAEFYQQQGVDQDLRQSQ